MCKRSYHNLNFIRIWPEKPLFFERWSWFKFNNVGLALGTSLKFYTSLSKGLKLKVRKFWGLILTFAEVTGEKLVGGGGLFALRPILNRAKFTNSSNFSWSGNVEVFVCKLYFYFGHVRNFGHYLYLCAFNKHRKWPTFSFS